MFWSVSFFLDLNIVSIFIIVGLSLRFQILAAWVENAESSESDHSAHARTVTVGSSTTSAESVKGFVHDVVDIFRSFYQIVQLLSNSICCFNRPLWTDLTAKPLFIRMFLIMLFHNAREWLNRSVHLSECPKIRTFYIFTFFTKQFHLHDVNYIFCYQFIDLFSFNNWSCLSSNLNVKTLTEVKCGQTLTFWVVWRVL